MQIGIGQSNFISLFGQGDGQIGGNGAFPDTAFITADDQFEFDIVHPVVDNPAVVFVMIGFTIVIIVVFTHFTGVKQTTFSGNRQIH
jgi:hypothetical protein